MAQNVSRNTPGELSSFAGLIVGDYGLLARISLGVSRWAGVRSRTLAIVIVRGSVVVAVVVGTIRVAEDKRGIQADTVSKELKNARSQSSCT